MSTNDDDVNTPTAAMSDERLAKLRDWARAGLLSCEAQELFAEIDRLRAAPGGVVVPVEPTEAMAKAGADAQHAWLIRVLKHEDKQGPLPWLRAIWPAILAAAAPTPEK